MKTLAFRALVLGTSAFLLSQVGIFTSLLGDLLIDPVVEVDSLFWGVVGASGLHVVGNLMAVVLAALLVTRRSDLAYVPSLALFVVMLPVVTTGFLMEMLPLRYLGPDWLWTIGRPRWQVMATAPWLALGAFLRFSTLFPVGSPARAQGSVNPATRKGLRSLRRLQDLSQRPGIVGATVAVLIGISVVGWLLVSWWGQGSDLGPGFLGVRFVVVLSAVLLLAFVGVANLQTTYRTLEQAGRRQMRWVVLGAVGGFSLALLGATTWFVLPPRLAEATTWLEVFLPGSVVMVILVALYLAVFYAGSIDPTLMIRRATVYGALGILFLFFLAGFSNLAEEFLESTVGLPGGLGTVLGGGGIAVVLIPVKHRIDEYMNRMLPVTTLAEANTSTATILFSDLVGYTSLTGEDQAKALTLMSVFHKAADRVARENSGRLVKTVADEVMLEFKRAQRAVDAARELQDEFHEAARKLDLPTPELSTGTHYGEVVRSDDGDLIGDTVNIASRVQGVAAPGQIVLSQAVADQLEGVELEDLGEQRLKNVPEPVRCWAVSS
jgi:class 3 adenylate cyclase